MMKPKRSLEWLFEYGKTRVQTEQYEARRNRITGNVSAWYRGEWCPPHDEHERESKKNFTPCQP